MKSRQSKVKQSKPFDFLIIGAGISGASLAYELAKAGKSVLVVEMEDVAGYHSTGRSAAMFAEIYGNKVVRQLTKYSRSFFENPPNGFCDVPLFSARGLMFISNEQQLDRLTALYEEVKPLSNNIRLEGTDFALNKVANLRKEKVSACLWDPDSVEIDVATLHQGYLKLAKRHGAKIVLNSPVKEIYCEHNTSKVKAGKHEYESTCIINATGAWGDNIACQANITPVGLKPKKRTVCIAPLSSDVEMKNWPLVVDIDEDFYFKPDGGNLLLSPADETLVEPMDAYSETIDVALAVDKVLTSLDVDITRISNEWAGLRTFTSDKSPVIGFDDANSQFFWLVGQGGYGIQMAPGIAKLASCLLLKKPIEDDLLSLGFEVGSVSPTRFKTTK